MDEQIAVKLDRKNIPAVFKWRKNIYRVESLQESWKISGAWWDGEDDNTFYRVKTDKGGIYELKFDHIRNAWSLVSIND